MDKLDLETPRFTQAKVLEIIPALTAKAMQNWTTRGIVQDAETEANPASGRQARRRYSAVTVIMLDFVSSVADLGIGPAVAGELAGQVGERAIALHDEYPAEIGDAGTLEFVEKLHYQERYARGFIYKTEGQHILDIRYQDFSVARQFFPSVYITVEIDRLILVSLNRIYMAEGKRQLGKGSTTKGAFTNTLPPSGI